MRPISRIIAMVLFLSGTHGITASAQQVAAKPTAPTNASAPAVVTAPTSPPVAATITSEGAYKQINLTVLVIDVPSGTVTAENTYHSGFGCGQKAPVITSQGIKVKLPNITLQSAMFADELKKAKLTSADSDADSLFGSDQKQLVEFSLGGTITNIHQQFCINNYQGGADTKGNMELAITWQVYSNTERKIIYNHSTSASISRDYWTPNGLNAIPNDLFRQNVQQLISDPDFRKILGGKPLAADTRLPAPTNVTPVPMTLILPATPRGIKDVQLATVTIEAGNQSGSGVLISPDGYILSVAHVIGSLPKVKLRWSDGATSEGTVVARVEGRDVALIKTNARASALALLTTPPIAGTPVYAVGSPLGEKFQGSVTKGVISGAPVVEGYAYLQSDVTVNPGNSGGPIVDENGYVLGVATRKLATSTISGMNFFVPVADALAYLGIKAK